MNQSPRVLFQMNPANPNLLSLFANINIEKAVHSKWNSSSFVVLRNLEVFRHVRIVVVLSEKEHALRNFAVQCQRSHNSILHRLLVEDWKGAGYSEANRTGQSVGVFALVIRGAATKEFSFEAG